MNTLDFMQVGGFPLTTRILDEIQKAFTVFNALGALSGDKTIITGCETVGINVADGVVFVNGEVFEFRGGSVQTKVKIVETPETLVFEDNVAKSVIKTRYVTFGTGVGAMDWVDFKPAFQTKNIAQLIERIEDLEARPGSNIPVGLIAIWGLPANQIPEGWAEYTPLQGRMPVGLKEGDTSFDTLLGYGGSKVHQLTIEQMPAHTHGTDGSSGASGGDRSEPWEGVGGGGPETGSTGGSQEFSILNPYRVVLYIQYLG